MAPVVGSRGALIPRPAWKRVGYRLPDEDRLLEAIEEALIRHPIVDSQRALGEHVRRVLHEADPDLRASDARIRRLAVENDLVRVRVRTGTTNEPAREACPVCGEALEQVVNKTLDGGTTVVGTRCTGCPYETGHRHEVPLRYEFVRADREPEREVTGPF